MDYVCILGLEVHKDIVVATISAGVPSLVAWCISKKWREQKQTEILSVKAEQIYFEVDKILSALVILEKQIDSNPGTTTTNSPAYIEFKSVCKEANAKISLFKDLINDVKPSYLGDFNHFFGELGSFEEQLKWVNLWRIGSGDRNPLVATFEHSKEMREKLKIQNMHDEIKNIKSKLAKVILHK